MATQILSKLANVEPLKPKSDTLRRRLIAYRMLADTLRRGLEALTWVVDERGLGGGRETDGLAWSLSLERLWESYVESVVRKEAALTGAEVKAGRLGQTVFRLEWSDPTHRSLGHLSPDFVIRRDRSIQIVDAKYKAHLAELDEVGWHRFTEDARDAHRADLHQILAYASLYDADEVSATLIYPLRRETWQALQQRHRDVSRAELIAGGRIIHLELRGLPFGLQI